MATTLWRRQFCPLHSRIITAAELTMDANGRPRIGLPLGAAEDVVAEFCMGMLADFRPDLPLQLRARCWAVPTTWSYRLGAQLMAQSASDNAETESFSTTETLSEVIALPATKALHDVDITVPIGLAQDNAQPDDTVYLRVALKYDAGRVTEDKLYLTLVEAWQETE